VSLWPYWNKGRSGANLASALVNWLVICLIIYPFYYVMVSDVGSSRAPEFSPGAVDDVGGVAGGGDSRQVLVPSIGSEPTPVRVEVSVEIIQPTALPSAEVPPLPLALAGSQFYALPAGYERLRIVGRFSNYWPPFGGSNCHADCELFADGGRVDEAIIEGLRVVACPVELLMGTRIEWPPSSGVVWTCRDRGGAITFYFSESGLPVYWFDFLSPDAFVDYGSYIQVDLWSPIK